MSITHSILGIVPGLQATAVVGRGLALVPKKFGGRVKSPKKMITGFTDIIIGTTLIKPTASIVAGL